MENNVSENPAPLPAEGTTWRRVLPAAAATVTLTVLAGSWTVVAAVPGHLAALMITSAMALPAGVPALHPWPPDDAANLGWIVENLAALLLIAVVAMRLSRPSASSCRAFAAGWVR